MLKENEYFDTYEPYLDFLKAEKSNKSCKLTLVVLSLLVSNYNGINKKDFIAAAKTTASHFARDTAELRKLGFIKVIDGEIFINPYMCYAGSEGMRQYHIKCWDANVRELGKTTTWMQKK